MLQLTCADLNGWCGCVLLSDVLCHHVLMVVVVVVGGWVACITYSSSYKQLSSCTVNVRNVAGRLHWDMLLFAAESFLISTQQSFKTHAISFFFFPQICKVRLVKPGTDSFEAEERQELRERESWTEVCSSVLMSLSDLGRASREMRKTQRWRGGQDGWTHWIDGW